MPRTHALVTLAALGTVAGTASFASADLVINGGFEQGPGAPPGLYTNLLAGSTDLTGWVVGGESIDIHDTGHTAAHSGQYSVDLAGFNLPGSITQTIATTPGGTYTLSFWYAGHPYHPYGGPALADVFFDGALVTLVARPPAPSTTDMNWVNFTADVTTTSSLTDLSFVSLTPNGSVIIDDVSLNAVPTPGALAAGSLALGLLARRSRR